MSYGSGKDLWLAAVRNVSGFNSTNTAYGDWRILNSGAAANYAVLRPGPYNRERMGLGGNRRENASTVIQVFRNYQDPDDVTALIDVVNTLLDGLEQQRVAGDGSGDVIAARIVEVREMQDQAETPDGPPVRIFVELVAVLDEEDLVTFTE